MASSTSEQGTSTFDVHRTRLSPKGQKKIIRLLFADGLSIEVVAKRFGVGASTIRRVMDTYAQEGKRRKYNGKKRRA